MSYKQEIRESLKLAVPVVIGQLGQVLMGNVDTLMLGKLGHVAVSASGLANNLFFLIVVLGMGIMSAITPLVAKANAENNNDLCRSYFLNGSIIAFLSGLLMNVAVYWAYPLFSLLDQPEADVVLATDYLKYISFSTTPMFMFLGFKGFSDGLSDTRPAMYITLLGLMLNVLFNSLLIPPMGVGGAALATTLTRIAMMLALLVWIMNGAKFERFKLFAQGLKIELAHFLQILKIGLPSGMQYFFEVGAFVGVSFMLGWMGEHASQYRAAHQITLGMASISYMLALGLSSAATIRVGDALGRKDREGIRRAASSGLILVMLLMSLAAIIFVIGKDFLPTLYQVEDKFVLQTASQLMLITAVFQIFDGMQVMGLGTLRGIQDVRFPTAVTFIAYWLISLPISYYLGIFKQMHVNGAWYAFVLALGFAAIFNNLRFFYKLKKLDLGSES